MLKHMCDVQQVLFAEVCVVHASRCGTVHASEQSSSMAWIGQCAAIATAAKGPQLSLDAPPSWNSCTRVVLAESCHTWGAVDMAACRHVLVQHCTQWHK
jgi:hypothetical protein